MTNLTICIAFVSLTILNWSLCRAAAKGERDE